MISKEALNKMCDNCERGKAANKQLCPFRSISNDYCDEYETIKQDLNKLEKIKAIIDEANDKIGEAIDTVLVRFLMAKAFNEIATVIGEEE